jgi:hypothetical protein
MFVGHKRLFMRFFSIGSFVFLSFVIASGSSATIALGQTPEPGGQAPIASPIPSVIPSPAPSVIPKDPRRGGDRDSGSALDAFRNMIDARACVAITAISKAVIDHPAIAKKMCELAAEREYNECFKKTGGDPRVRARFSRDRFIRKCAGKRNTTLEGCTMMQDFAHAFINGCEEGILTVFNTEPEVDPYTGFAKDDWMNP